ncbi:pentapeptide repeat-containing protein [Flavitalea sp.]|nr:pentapeptide repeat-containing protein [Flavitalea sp.]
MSENYFEDDQFDSVDFTTRPFVKGEYENCRFINCNFANMDLSNVQFIECEFTGCNISMTKITGATLNTVKFKESKIIGINFENCNDFLFSVEFENCILNFSSFYKRVMKKTLFKDCTLHEVDFTDTDLSGSSFIKCDFHKAKFENTNLEKADLRSSFNYALDPDINKIRKAKFSIEGVVGLLHKYDIVVEL